ncbi:MAG: hypothetical protein AMJ66_11370 [Betaproteobacteria bacterium SG8_40]|nr:MAG: hypothetical protein AMJ66_11370 [Betaproteobacteria bacterium SG8_40]
MKGNFDKCFALILQDEGGYVNDPRDPGGRTNMGVTQRAWEAYVRKEVNEEFMRKLTPEMVKPFYQIMYWNRLRCDEMPAGVDYAAFDLAVNSGVNRAVKFLQEIVGVPVDGVVGPRTLAAIANYEPRRLIIALCDARLHFLQGLSTFGTYGKGWTRRVTDVRSNATAMA